MDSHKLILRIFVTFLFFTSVNSLNAQYIIEEIEYQIPISHSLFPETEENSGSDLSEQDAIDFFLNLPIRKLKEAAVAEGGRIRKEKQTIYSDGDNFAIETQSDEGKETMVLDMKTGTSHTIMWAQKMVIEANPKDLEKIQKMAESSAEKTFEAMSKNMPPEMLRLMKEEMEKEKEKAKVRAKNKSPVKRLARPTGRKKKLHGFDCEEYRINKSESVTIIWASRDESGITKALNRFSEKLDNLYASFDDEGDDDIDGWTLVPGRLPVEVRTFTRTMMMDGPPMMMGMDGPALTVRVLTKIEKKKPSTGIFKVPGKKEGFKTVSVLEQFVSTQEALQEGMGNFQGFLP
ncbi:MAG: hypothetical protein ACE5FY_07915 [Nitrospiria bacterium]